MYFIFFAVFFVFQIRSRVVVVKYDEKPKLSALFGLARRFGSIREHLVLKNKVTHSNTSPHFYPSHWITGFIWFEYFTGIWPLIKINTEQANVSLTHTQWPINIQQYWQKSYISTCRAYLMVHGFTSSSTSISRDWCGLTTELYLIPITHNMKATDRWGE